MVGRVGLPSSSQAVGVGLVVIPAETAADFVLDLEDLVNLGGLADEAVDEGCEACEERIIRMRRATGEER